MHSIKHFSNFLFNPVLIKMKAIILIFIFVFGIVQVVSAQENGKIVFVSNRDGNDEIYMMNTDGSNLSRITNNSVHDRYPSWSPDGLQVAFHRDVAGSPQVFVMDARSRVVRQLTSAGRNHDPTWAPDGRHIAFVSTRTGRRQVWIMDVETGRVRQLTTMGDARLPSWSPRIPEQTQP